MVKNMYEQIHVFICPFRREDCLLHYTSDLNHTDGLLPHPSCTAYEGTYNEQNKPSPVGYHRFQQPAFTSGG